MRYALGFDLAFGSSTSYTTLAQRLLEAQLNRIPEYYRYIFERHAFGLDKHQFHS